MKRLSFLLISILFFTSNIFSQFYGSQSIQKLNMATMAITNLYVDPVNEDELVEDAIVGMLENLDPHSSYISKDEVKKMNEPLEGSFDGIGIQFNMLEDTLFVVQTISGGPSEKVGIRAGDRIIFVNDTIIAGVKIQTSDIQKKLRGKKGTSVNVKVKRKGESQLISFKIVRDKIPIYSLDASYMMDKETGYIKLNRFAATTLKEFNEALEKLKAQGMKNLILDLQGNGGGYLIAAINLADEFLSKGQLIVYTEGSKQARKTENATAKGTFEKGRLAVLIDESSASASEVFTGAVQDWDRGVVVGRRSFGKGLVQQPVPLNDGSMIRLTIARYYTPTGRSIQRPYDDGIDKYNKDLIDRYNHGELLHADSIVFPDSLKKETLVYKRTVYGGGGIMPDIFVPIDTTRYTDYHKNLVYKGILYKTTLNYIDRERESALKQYEGNFELFRKQYQPSEELLNEVIEAAEKEDIEFNEEQYNTSKDLIKFQLKATVANDLFKTNEYFEIINEKDDVIKRAYEIISSKTEYDRILKNSK